MVDVITPILTQFLLTAGGSGVMGAVVGYALKKFMKLVALAAGAIIFVMMALHFKGIVTINYAVLTDQLYQGSLYVVQIIGKVIGSANQQLIDSGAAGTVLGTASVTFMIGLALGFKKG